MSRIILFKIVATVITVTLLLFQIVIWKKLAPYVDRTRFRKTIRLSYFMLVFAGQSIMWFAVLFPGRGINFTLPGWYLPLHGVLLAINYAHFVWMLPLGLLWLVGMAWRRLRRKQQPVESAAGVSRADFLKRAAGAATVGLNLVPAVTSAAAISGMFLGSREIWVNEKPIAIAGLHEDLKGLRILQISDIHIGQLIGEKYLNFALGLMQAARPDYVVVTCDIIDNNNAFLPTASTFFSLIDAMLPARRTYVSGGRAFGVMGNHDYIDDGLTAAQAFEKSGLRMLRNQVKLIGRGLGRMQLAGLDYPPLGRGRHQIMQQYYSETRSKLRADLPTVLLNHNPADFEYLKSEKIDLVLSGHTHGGQINFSQKQNSYLNGAHWIYKYYVDHYLEQGSQLYVNRGLGHWFPLRVSCPPEITVIVLT